MVVLQEDVPRFSRYPTNFGLFVSLLIQGGEPFAASANINARVRRVAYQGQDLPVARSHPLHVAPVAASRHDRQLKPFRLQMQVQLAGAGEAFEVLEHFFDRSLNTRIRMLLAERLAAADVAWRQAVVLFAAFGFLPQALLHPVDDRGQFEFVEGPLDAQHEPVLGIGGIVQTTLVGEDHVLEATDPYELRQS